jgi:type I restriction enzyme S subunit
VCDPERAVFASYLIRLRPKPDIEAGYLYAFFQSDNYWSQVSEEKEGSAQPNVNGDKLSRLRIPAVPQEMQRAVADVVRCVRRRQDGDSAEFPVLPAPLTEQRAVLARIEQLSIQIQEVRRLRQESQHELDALGRSILKSDMRARPTPMRELVKLRPPDVTVEPQETYQFAGVYSFGRGVFRGQEKAGTEFAYPRLTRLRTGNFVYPKLMAWEGAFGVVPPTCDSCVVSTEFPVFEVFEDRVLPEVLDTYFRMPSIWPAISGASTGTNVRRLRLNPNDFLSYEMPVPSRNVQELLRLVTADIAPLRRLQTETAKEVDAFLPSVLSKAFAGEL